MSSVCSKVLVCRGLVEIPVQLPGDKEDGRQAQSALCRRSSRHRYGSAVAEREQGPARRAPVRRLSVERRRAEVIDAAIRVFGRRPGKELSIDDVVAAAGTSRASVYRCFETKQGLYIATMRELGSRLAARLEGDLGSSPVERLEEGLRRYFDFVAEHGAGCAALLRLDRPGGPEGGREAVAELRRLVYAWVYRTLEVTSPSPVLQVAVHAWVAGMERTALERGGGEGLERREIEALLTAQFMTTLLAAAVFDQAAADRLIWLMGH